MVSYELFLNYEMCTGCRLCEIACAMAHENTANPQLSRIHILQLEKGSTTTPIPARCMQCGYAACEAVCPVNAISTDPETGSRLIEEKKCIGCSACVGACPFGAATLNQAKGLAYICDLCQGDPVCVRFCPFAALEYVPSDAWTSRCRQSKANKILSARKFSTL